MYRTHVSSKAVALLAFAVLAFAGTAAHAAAPDANVKGLWLMAPEFPTDKEKVEVLEFSDNQKMGVTTYTRLFDGMVTFEIRRQEAEGSELQGPDDVEGLIEMRVDNDDIDEAVIEENRGSIDVRTDAGEFAKILTYPCAYAEYISGANEDTRKNFSLFIFTDTYTFEVSVSMGADSVEEYEDASSNWLQNLELVENKSKSAGGSKKAASAKIKGLWLEIPGFPEDVAIETDTDKEGMAVTMAQIEDGFTLTIMRHPNSENAITTKNVATILSGLSDVAEDAIKVTVPDKKDRPFPAARKYPFAMAEYTSDSEGKNAINAAMFFFPKDFFFLVHMQAESEEIIEKYSDAIEQWFKNMKFVEK